MVEYSTTPRDDDPLGNLGAIFGDMQRAAGQVAAGIQSISNNWSNLQAQNADIAGGRWTLNNAVYQFGQLSPIGQAVLAALAAYAVAKLMGD